MEPARRPRQPACAPAVRRGWRSCPRQRHLLPSRGGPGHPDRAAAAGHPVAPVGGRALAACAAARRRRPQHEISIPPKAKRANVPPNVTLHYLELLPEDIDDDVLTPLATAAYCLRDLSTREALSVGDSALRSGQVELHALRARVASLRNRGAPRARNRLELLDARAANAFESCARTLLIEAGITGFVPQVTIRHNGWIGRVDLAHRHLRIVIECDGFEHHGTLDAMTRDCTRHTRLAAAGWGTFRFTWYRVMHRPDWVLEQIRDTIAAVQSPSR